VSQNETQPAQLFNWQSRKPENKAKAKVRAVKNRGKLFFFGGHIFPSVFFTC